MSFARIHKPARTGAAPVRARTAPAQTLRAPGGRMPVHDIGRVPIAGTVQRRAAPGGPKATERAANRTGLPDGLKAGLESMSGMSMDAVRVHFGSAEPARIDALAFTRGTDIHLAPGQETHLAHEAWHVVQQAEGRVNPTLDVGGTAVNDDPGLEREADRMGDASAAHGHSRVAAPQGPPAPMAASAGSTAQRVLKIKDGDREGSYKTRTGKATNDLIRDTDTAIGDELKAGWKNYVRDLADKDAAKTTFQTTDAYYDHLRDKYEKATKSGGKTRPNFSSIAYELAKVTYGLQTEQDQSGLKPSEGDLAMPHRFPYASIEKSVDLFIKDKEDDDDLDRWTGRLESATEERLELNLPKIKDKSQKKRYKDKVEQQISDLKSAKKKLKKAKDDGDSLDLSTPVVQQVLKTANNMHGNIPDFGPHSTVNIPVSNRLHIHVEKPPDWDDSDEDRQAPPTPGSLYAMQMSPHRVDKGVAYDDEGEWLVGTDGRKYDPSRIEGFDDLMEEHQIGKTTIDESNLDDF